MYELQQQESEVREINNLTQQRGDLLVHNKSPSKRAQAFTYQMFSNTSPKFTNQ